MVELIDVTVTRGSRVLVRNLGLTVRPGRPFWIVGPNGAGKSSLLRVLAGLDAPARGRVRWGDGQAPLYFHGGMGIPQCVTVGDWRRTARLLAPARRAAGLWPPVVSGRRVGRLSTGEQKRLLLDVVLRKPGPLLLDEPFAHLSREAKAVLARCLSDRSLRHVVVVATNQAVEQAGLEAGLRLEAGRAVPLGAYPGRSAGHPRSPPPGPRAETARSRPGAGAP